MHFRTPHSFTNFSDSFSGGFSPLLSLVNISASSHLMSDIELETILEQSRRNNLDIGVTGMLLYYEGAFMQLLEGTEEMVRALYERIRLDPRHRGVVPLLEEYIAERSFPDWSMGYYRLMPDEAAHVPDSIRFADANHFLAYFQETPQKSMILLQGLSKGARY
jgi:hypothetical protein